MAEPPWILAQGQIVLAGLDVGLPRPTQEQLIADVRQFHRESALTILLRLNLALTHSQPLGQVKLIQDWLPHMAEQLLQAMHTHEASAIFYEHQVLNLIRLVILFASPEGERRCDRAEDFTLLVRVLLQMTDMIFQRDSGHEPGDRAWVFANLTRSEVFLHDEHGIPNVMARNYDLFVLVPRLLNRRGHTYDLPGTFARVTGLLIEDYIAIGFALLSKYDLIEPAMMGHAPIGLHQERYFAETRMEPEVTERVWPLISKPLNEYQAALKEEWDATTGASRWAAMRTFSQFPMIGLSNGTTVAVSRRFFRDRITHGIYWILANRLPSAERDHFTTFFGHVFESYVCRSLTRAAGREIGGQVELLNAVEPGLDEAAAQLATAIEAGQLGALAGIRTGANTKYYPIIVTYEPLPSHPLAQGLYEAVLYRGRRLREDGVKPVTLLNTRDIESIEAIVWAGGAWPDLLTRKHSERYRGDSFHNYLYRAFHGSLPRNEYLACRWTRMGHMIGMRLFGEPLERPSDLRGQTRRRHHH